MLGGSAVHHHAVAGLQNPRPLPRGDDERASPQPRHPGLERGEGAQRRIEEEESEDLPAERLRLRRAFQVRGQGEEILDLLRPERGQIEEILHAGTSESARARAATWASSSTRGGRRRTTFGSPLVPARIPLVSSSSTIARAGRVVLRPRRKPSPWMPVTGPTWQVSRMSLESCCTRGRRPSSSMASITASIRAQARGPPPKVVPRSPALSPWPTASLTSRAPAGKPPAMPLAVVRRSGVTP